MAEPRETPFMKRLLVALGAGVPQSRWWRQNSGQILMVDEQGQKRVFRAAPKGAADLLGIVAPHGMHVHVETKSAAGQQKPAQQAWQAMVEKHGGLYLLCAYDAHLTMDANVYQAVEYVRTIVNIKRVGPLAPPRNPP